MSNVNIAVAGCLGRMGRSVIAATRRDASVSFVAGSVSDKDDPRLDPLLAEGAFDVTTSPQALFAKADAVIDFTTPEHTLALAQEAAAQKKLLVSGTTGLSDEQSGQLADYAKEVPIIWAANMSVGVNLLFSLVQQAAKALDDYYDIEIVEMHHRHKVDAPSGTALALGQAAATGRDVNLEEVAVKSREGHTGARKAGEIGFATLRGGSVIGEHSVIFAGEKDRITLSHDSASRDIYAEGAIKAALWGVGKPAGLYSMKDVLGLA